MTVELKTDDMGGNQSVPIYFLRANYTYECKLSTRNFVRDAKDVMQQLGQTSAALDHLRDVVQHLPLVASINGRYYQKREITECVKYCIDEALVLLQGED